MKQLLSSIAALALFVSCASPAQEPEAGPDIQRMTVEAAVVAAPRLYVIDLPAGDTRGWDIDYPGGTGRTKYTSATWLDDGDDTDPEPDDFDGVLFRGQGVGVTHVRPVGDQAVLVDRHNGIVRFEAMTIHCGARQGVWFGLEHRDRPTLPKFRLEMKAVLVQADAPSAGSTNQHTTVWGLFGYQADVDLEDVIIDCIRSAEHASYWRGFARTGYRAKRVHIKGAGSQGFKFRNTPTESRFVAGARIWLTDCKVEEIMQPWTWRGPGNFVAEGGGCDIILQRCEFVAKRGPEYCRAVMIDDAHGDFYPEMGGYANGHIWIEQCLLSGGPGTENYTPLLRVSNNGGGAWKSCRSLTVIWSGIWGQRTQLQLANIPAGKTRVASNNTPAIQAWCAARGYDVTHETSIPGPNSVAPVSMGLVR